MLFQIVIDKYLTTLLVNPFGLITYITMIIAGFGKTSK